MRVRQRCKVFSVPMIGDEWDLQLARKIDVFLTDEPEWQRKVVNMTFLAAGDYQLAFLIYEEVW